MQVRPLLPLTKYSYEGVLIVSKEDPKRDCKYYDWGNTAPREYGAFCAPHNGKDVRTIKKGMCSNCKDYSKKT